MSRADVPVFCEHPPIYGRQEALVSPRTYGVTIREHFAGLAMQGMLANEAMSGHEHVFAACAVKQADALIAELAKPVTP